MKKQKAVAGTPDDNMNRITIRLKIDGKPVELTFLANIREDEVDAVITNWLPRIEAETAEPEDLLKDLVRYINSKSHYGFKAKIPST